MTVESDTVLRAGDRMCISVELIREWHEVGRGASPIFVVVDVRQEADGTKTVLVERAKEQEP